jgi:hypothetical protein
VTKIAYIFQHTLRGPVPLRRGDGVVEIKIFRWWELIRLSGPLGPQGWALHLLVFCNGITTDFMHQSRQGVFAIGRFHGLFVEFAPHIEVYRLWLWPPVRFEKGPMR